MIPDKVTIPAGSYTAAEFDQLLRPPCPVCGTPVRFDRIDVTTREDLERTGERQYVAGRWSCPHGCDPTTGERRHYDQQWGRDGFGDYWLQCSCGFEEHGIPAERFGEVLAEHQP